MKQYLEYFVLLFLFIYSITGLVIAGQEAQAYNSSDCGYAMTNYVAGSSFLYLALSVTLSCALGYAKYHERNLDIIDLLNENGNVNIAILLGTLGFILWGIIEVARSTCFSHASLYHVGMGLMLIQTASLFIQILVTYSSIRLALNRLCETVRDKKQQVASNITGPISTTSV